ncbi:MAG: HAD family hydrolase [Dehalococcoidia bacterium]
MVERFAARQTGSRGGKLRVTIRAVLFDVGGPLDTEEVSERLIDRDIAEALASASLVHTAADLRRASDAAVASFAPDAYRAMIWMLSGRDRSVAFAAYGQFASNEWRQRRMEERGGIEWRAGIMDVLRALRRDGLLLGLAANQPATILQEIERAGLAGLFGHREVSGHHGHRKPDVRLFLRACEELGVGPAECVMVGDRIDNDIAPARSLGMKTVLLRSGRHRAQQPRSWDEEPDVTVFDSQGIADGIEQLRQR